MPRYASFALALLHLAVTFVHDVAHVGLGLFSVPVSMAYIVLVIHVLPAVGAWLLLRGHTWPAFACFATGFPGSLAIATYSHFIFAGPDHVSHVAHGPWGSVFFVTALLLSVVDALAVLAVTADVRRLLQQNHRHANRAP
jgi:hypothetical protein